MSIDWTDRRRSSRSGERPPEWPEGVHGISLDGLSLLGIDDENRLYWDGQRIATLTLTRWQKVGAFVVTASALIGAMAAVTSAIADFGSQAGRFQISDYEGQILRVDTSTGEARECALTNDQRTVCTVVFDRAGKFAPANRGVRS
jgi:hypothetical protein